MTNLTSKTFEGKDFLQWLKSATIGTYGALVSGKYALDFDGKNLLIEGEEDTLAALVVDKECVSILNDKFNKIYGRV